MQINISKPEVKESVEHFILSCRMHAWHETEREMHERKLNDTLIIIKYTALLIILLINSLVHFPVALGLCGYLLNVFNFFEQTK